MSAASDVVEPRGRAARLFRWGLSSLAVAAAVDLALSRAHEFPIRRDALELVLVDAAIVAVVVLPALAVWLALTLALPARRLERLAWAAAVLPLVGWAIVRRFPLDAATGLILGIPLAIAALATILRLGGHRRAPDVALAVAIAAWLGAAGWAAHAPPVYTSSGSIAAPQEGTKPPNVLLVVLDTVRPDHLSLYGYERPTTPRLEQLGRRSTVFDRAVSSANFTLPAHASLFTGLWSRTHGAGMIAPGAKGAFAGSRLHASAQTLAETLRERGYATGAICANTGYLTAAFQLDQGFDTYVATPTVRALSVPLGLALAKRVSRRWWSQVKGNQNWSYFGEEVTAGALAWVDDHPHEPFLLFLNYMDAHQHRAPAADYRALYPHSWPTIEVALTEAAPALAPDQSTALRATYDATVRSLDDELGAVFDGLARRGRLDDTLIVIVSDHGESLGEHGNLSHGEGMYESDTRIVFLVHEPGQSTGRRVRELVSIADVFPTVGAILGVPLPAGIEGIDARASHPERTVFAFRSGDDGVAEAVYHGDAKLIVTEPGGREELYDLAVDPGEGSNLAPVQTARVSGLRARLAEGPRGPRFVAADAGDDPALIERLRALGYINGPE